jgi:hypothetical protein
MQQEVQQTITLPGDASAYTSDEALTQLKSGLVAYLNSQLGGSDATITDDDVTLTVRTISRESGRRLQTDTNGVAVDYIVVSTTSIEAAFTHTDFVTNCVTHINTQGSSLQLDHSTVVAEEPAVQTEVVFNVIMAEEQAVADGNMETTINGITRSLELELGYEPAGETPLAEVPGRGIAASAESEVASDPDRTVVIVAIALAVFGATICIVAAKMLLCRKATGDEVEHSKSAYAVGAHSPDSSPTRKLEP